MTTSLSPWNSVSARIPAGISPSLGTTSTAKSALRASQRAVELADRLGLREPAILGLEGDAPERRALAEADVDDDVALLAAPGVAAVADGVGGVTARRGDLGDRLARPAPRRCGPWRCRARPPRRRPRSSPGRPSARRPAAWSATIVLVHRDEVDLLLVGGVLDRADGRALELRERVALVGGGELLGQRLAMAAQQLVDERLDLMLDRGRGLGAEVLLEQLRDRAGLGAERRGDGAARAARRRAVRARRTAARPRAPGARTRP